MDDVRKKLIELIAAAPVGPNFRIADHLIVNGVTIQRWIPLTEKRPNEFVSVLVYVPEDAPLQTVHEAYFLRGCWVTKTAILEEHAVTHWMPLPELPEGGK
jgi:hypothetical protein